MSRQYYQRLKRRFDPSDRVSLALSSEDEELGRYLRAVRARASTRLEFDGSITIQIDDEMQIPRVVWLEEFAHALQLLKSAKVELSYEDPHNRKLEAEVATCLLARSDFKSLAMPDDIRNEYISKAAWGS